MTNRMAVQKLESVPVVSELHQVSSVVLVLGATPPPYNGMSVATNLVLSGLEGRVPFVHLDTADRRNLSNLGRLDWTNIRLAMWHGLKCCFLLLRRRPSIVYVPISQATLPFLRDCLFLVPARLFRKLIVVHLHGSYFQQFYRQSSGCLRWLIRFTLADACRAIVLGDSLTTVFDGIIPQDRIRVVPNGIPDYVNGGYREMKPQKPRRVLFLATLTSEKGIFDVLRAIPRVLQNVCDCVFTFAGEWFRSSEKAMADRLAKDLGVAGHLEFTGPVGPQTKHKLFLSSDVFVFPPNHPYEGHPFVILEAMCAGLPIVTTKTGCVEETVKDGVTGFIVERNNPTAVADGIIRLLKDEELRTRMGAAARNRFLSMYTVDKFIDRLERVIVEASTVDAFTKSKKRQHTRQNLR
jgi:glycosyltransferase involved in cell wall biosynthesis